MFMLSCIGSGLTTLTTVWSPAQGVLPTVNMIKKLKNRGQGSSWTVAPTE
jgi:hypothetical protein